MAKDGTFVLKIKNGDYQYKYNSKSGQYDYDRSDLVENHSDLGSALVAFLDFVTDDYNEDKITLSFVPAKKKNKK